MGWWVNEADCAGEKGRRTLSGEKKKYRRDQARSSAGGRYLDIHDCSESLRSAWSTEIPGVGVISHVVLASDEKLREEPL